MAKQDGKGDKQVVEAALRVSAGTVDKVLDLAFNPTREKLREVTIVDRMQGRLFPLLDIINTMQQYVIEIALYRHDSNVYTQLFDRPQPIPPNLTEEFLYRTAQWQKSVLGKNLERATDIALAEIETKLEGEEYLGGVDAWKED